MRRFDVVRSRTRVSAAPSNLYVHIFDGKELAHR